MESPRDSRRLTRLRQGFELSLGKWQALLSQAVTPKEYDAAFRETNERFPSFRDAVCGDGGGEGVLHMLLEREFPTLNREMPDALRGLVEKLFEQVAASSKEEFELVLREYGLAEKLAKLERMEDELKRAQADGSAEMPPPLAMSPEDEMRTPAMEVKLNYQRALEKELDKLRKSNAEAEAKVAALDNRAKRVLQTVDARAGAISRLAAAAEAAGLTGEGEEEEDDG